MRAHMIVLPLMMAFLLAVGRPVVAHAAEWEFSPGHLDLQKLASDEGSDSMSNSAASASIPGKKQIGRGLLFSLIVPGTGQLYAGPWWRAVPWIAVEAASWTVFAIYESKGQDKTNEFQHFADTHFSRARYKQAEDSLKDINGGELPPNFTHTLPSENNQQYYEMIGKYLSQFGYGWDDATGDNPDGPTLEFDGTTANFYYYAGMRGDANDLLHVANIGMEVVLVNHILSALDAALLVRLHNRQIEKAGGIGQYLRYEHREINGADARFLTLRIPLD
jgi:hypothetical protein